MQRDDINISNTNIRVQKAQFHFIKMHQKGLAFLAFWLTGMSNVNRSDGCSLADIFRLCRLGDSDGSLGIDWNLS